MSAVETIDATAEPDDTPTSSTDIAVVAPTPGANIIRADAPQDIISKATDIANALKGLIDNQRLSTDVGGGRKHVNVEGWQALGAMLGALGGEALHAETLWTRRVLDENGRPQRTAYTAHVKRYYPKAKGGGLREETTYEVNGYDWEACVEVRTASGAIVGRAEAMCSREEGTWSTRDEYAVRSMAETRAESRAYRRAAGWIVSIAGYSPTPSEEMPPQQDTTLPAWAEPANGDHLTAAIVDALTAAGVPEAAQQDAGRAIWGALQQAADGGPRPQYGVAIFQAFAAALRNAQVAA